MRERDVVVQLADRIAVRQRHAARSGSIPVLAIGPVQIDIAAADRLREVAVQALAAALPQAPVLAGPRAGQRAVSLHVIGECAKPFAQAMLHIEGDMGAGRLDKSCIAKVDTVSACGQAACVAARVDGIQGDRAKRRVQARTQRIRQIAGRGLQTGSQAGVGRQAVDHRSADKTRPLLLAAIQAHLAGSNVVLDPAFADHQRRAGECLPKYAPGSAGLDDGDLQVSVGAGGLQVSDCKRAGGNGRRVDQIAFLADFHGRVAFRRAADYRRVASLLVRSHGLIGGQLHAEKAHAVEQRRIGVCLSHDHLAFEGVEAALQIGVLAPEFRRSAASGSQVRIVAQAPFTQVDP